MKRGDTLEVTVEKGVYRGLGLARHEGQVVFVPRGRPGDRLRVRVDSVTRGYVRAVAEAVLAPGPGQRDAPCPFFDAGCGGCAYQHIDYATQLVLKEAVLQDALRRAGVPWDAPIPVRPSPAEGWRTRATLHFRDSHDGLCLGFHEEGTRRLVPVERCLQLSAAMTLAATSLRDALSGHPEWRGQVQDLELAESLDGPGLVASLATGLDPGAAAALARLADAAPGLTGFGVAAGRGRRRRFLSLSGDPHVVSTVHGERLRAHVESFFQANRFLAGDLVQAVEDAVPADRPVLDLYAGVGLFAVPLGRRSPEVRGLEVAPSAVADARANAESARLSHVRVQQGDVEAGLTSLRPRDDEVVVLDPPRTGAGTSVVARIAGRRPPVVVYVSCDPPTLGRDLHTFAEAGYRAQSVRAFDLFPETFHLETVVTLTPAPL
jgi:23S rRNA (uracil1939-C5)-methyltransferase